MLQIGADIYCDTLLILNLLERLQPAPSLFPSGVGTATAIGWWAEKFTYMPAVCLAFALVGEKFPPGLVEERSAFFGLDLSKATTVGQQPLYLQRLRIHLRWLAEMLSDGRPFLLGQQPSAADLAAYHPLWFIQENAGDAAHALLPLAPLSGWYDRVGAIGHGTPTDLPASEALVIARVATPVAVVPGHEPDLPAGCALGSLVTVTADDSGRDPVEGTLVGFSPDDITISRRSDDAGIVHVHFPRAGFDILPDPSTDKPATAT